MHTVTQHTDTLTLFKLINGTLKRQDMCEFLQLMANYPSQLTTRSIALESQLSLFMLDHVLPDLADVCWLKGVPTSNEVELADLTLYCERYECGFSSDDISRLYSVFNSTL